MGPHEISQFLSRCKSLGFDQRPNYEELRGLLLHALERTVGVEAMKELLVRPVFDWDVIDLGDSFAELSTTHHVTETAQDHTGGNTTGASGENPASSSSSHNNNNNGEPSSSHHHQHHTHHSSNDPRHHHQRPNHHHQQQQQQRH